MVADRSLGLVARRCDLVANWPYTLLGIMPTNRVLMATEPASAGPDSRVLITKWAALHAGRTALGFAATLIFLWASMSGSDRSFAVVSKVPATRAEQPSQEFTFCRSLLARYGRR